MSRRIQAKTKPVLTKTTAELFIDFLLKEDVHVSNYNSINGRAENFGLNAEEVSDTLLFSDHDTGETERTVVFKFTGGCDDGIIYLQIRESKDSYANYSYYDSHVVKPAGTKVVEIFE